MKLKHAILGCVAALICYLQTTDANGGYLVGCFYLETKLCSDKPEPSFQKSCGMVGEKEVWVSATVIWVSGTYGKLVYNPPVGLREAVTEDAQCSYYIAYTCDGIEQLEEVLVPQESWSCFGETCYIAK